MRFCDERPTREIWKPIARVCSRQKRLWHSGLSIWKAPSIRSRLNIEHELSHFETLWMTIKLMFRHKTCSRRIGSRRGKVRKEKVAVSAAGSLSCPLSFLSLIIWDIISSPAMIWTSEASYWSFRPLIEHGYGGNPLFVINSYARRKLIRSLSFSQTNYMEIFC